MSDSKKRPSQRHLRYPPSAEPLSQNVAEKVIRRCIEKGRIDLMPHLRMRMADRGFDAQDLERVLRYGTVDMPPDYCIKNGTWRYRVRAKVEGCPLVIVVVFDEGEDYDERPLLLAITGYWTGEGTKHGKKAEAKGKPDRSKAASKNPH